MKKILDFIVVLHLSLLAIIFIGHAVSTILSNLINQLLGGEMKIMLLVNLQKAGGWGEPATVTAAAATTTTTNGSLTRYLHAEQS